MIQNKLKYTFKINNIDMYAFLSKRDFSLSQKDRIDLLNEILYTADGHLNEYFECFLCLEYKEGQSIFNPSSKQPLSHDMNFCTGLESLANYILYSQDGEKLNKKTEYNIYKDEKEFHKNDEEKYYDKDIDGRELDDRLDILISESHNEYYEKNQKIFVKDLKRHRVLFEYEETIDFLVKVLKEAQSYQPCDGEDNKNTIKKRYSIGNTISNIRKEQLAMKNILDKPIIFKNISKSGEAIPEDDIDGFDFYEVEKMFKNANVNQITPFGDLRDVTKAILSNLDLSEFEIEVISMVTEEKKLNISSIARKLNVDPRYVRQTLAKLRTRIINEYMKAYELYWYTFIDYGWWKTCESCGETKLLSTTYWYQNNGSNDGFRSICKKCSNFGKKQE